MDADNAAQDAALEVDLSTLLMPDFVQLCQSRGQSAPDVLQQALDRVTSRNETNSLSDTLITTSRELRQSPDHEREISTNADISKL